MTTNPSTWAHDPDRLFAAEPRQRELARHLYELSLIHI